MDKRCYISKSEKMDPMNEIEVTEHVLGLVMIQQYSLNAGFFFKRMEMTQ